MTARHRHLGNLDQLTSAEEQTYGTRSNDVRGEMRITTLQTEVLCKEIRIFFGSIQLSTLDPGCLPRRAVQHQHQVSSTCDLQILLLISCSLASVVSARSSPAPEMPTRCPS